MSAASRRAASIAGDEKSSPVTRAPCRAHESVSSPWIGTRSSQKARFCSLVTL
jgi:hypothetical protein